MLTRQDKIRALIALRNLRLVCIFPHLPWSRRGICSFLMHYEINCSNILLYAMSWEHYSGDFMYPVPYLGDPLKGYWKHTYKYNPFTKYGRMRIRLLNHLIRKLKEELNE